MRVISTLVPEFLLIFNYIDISSAQSSPKTRDFLSTFGQIHEHEDHQESSSQFDHYSNRESSTPHESSHTSSRPTSPASDSSTASPSSYAASSSQDSSQSMSLSIRPCSYDKLTPEQIGYIRLIPRTNMHHVFEFRRYVLPFDRILKRRTSHNLYEPMPAKEYTVLSTSDGEVLATLEKTGFLAGMYHFNLRRVKVNMNSGSIELMTPKEMEESPVGCRRPIIPRKFKIEVVNQNSLEALHH